MRNRHIIFGLIILVLAIGCRKNEEVVAAQEPVAGKGGKNKMLVTAKHYETAVDTGWVFLKYNTLTQPKDMKFDDSARIKNVSGKYQAQFDSLKNGKYFIYCLGRDLSKIKPNDSLWGSAPLHIVDTFARTYDLSISTINWYDFTHNYQYQ